MPKPGMIYKSKLVRHLLHIALLMKPCYVTLDTIYNITNWSLFIVTSTSKMSIKQSSGMRKLPRSPRKSTLDFFAEHPYEPVPLEKMEWTFQFSAKMEFLRDLHRETLCHKKEAMRKWQSFGIQLPGGYWFSGRNWCFAHLVAWSRTQGSSSSLNSYNIPSFVW